MVHEILLLLTFLMNKKNMFDSESLVTLVLINNICHSKNKNKKKEKIQKDINYLNEIMAEKQKRHKCIFNIFAELVLIEKEEFRD